MDALRPRLGELGIGLLRELGDPPLQLLDVPRDPAAPELDPGRGGSELGVGRRLDLRPAPRARPCRRPARTRPGARSCAGSPRGCRTSSPTRRCRRRSPGGRCTRLPARPASTVSRSGPGKSVFQSSVSPPISVGWQAKLATTAIGSPSSRVHAKHRHAVVHRPLAPDPVDADPGRATGSPADARRLPAAPGRVDGSREQVGQRLHPGANAPVSASPATVEPRETLGALWLCAAFTSTASGGIPVSFCTRSRTAAVMSAPAKTRSIATIATGVRPSSRTSACPIIGSRIPSARPVRADQQPCGRPHGGVTSTRATPAVKLMDGPFSLLGRPARAYASGRRFLSANHGFSRACSTSSGSSSTAIHWSPVPGSECASIEPSGART